jgi:hypothetical protein
MVMLTSRTIYQIAAISWLVIGVVLLIAGPEWLYFNFLGNRVPSGWAALLLAVYCGVRWWGLRSAYIRRGAAEEMERRRPPRRRPDEPEPERNPDFIFDEPPPEKPG